jgi:hypothetical protein
MVLFYRRGSDRFYLSEGEHCLNLVKPTLEVKEIAPKVDKYEFFMKLFYSPGFLLQSVLMNTRGHAPSWLLECLI